MEKNKLKASTIEKYKEKASTDNLGEWLRVKYCKENLSNRQIMEILSTTNTIVVTQLLIYYDIPMRTKNESIKLQWAGNDKRKVEQGARMKDSTKGNTNKRFTEHELIQKCKEKGWKFISRQIKNKYSHITYECMTCGVVDTQSLGNFDKHGCFNCAVLKRTFADQSTVICQRRKTRKWRKKVLGRDDYVCRKCGNKNKEHLRAHHIESFSSNEELRFEISNGITLCKYCHDCGYEGSFHMVYGVYNNNAKQLKEFLSL